MKINNIKKDFDFLFDCNFFSDDFDPENDEEHLKFAEKFLNYYSWKEIYAIFYEKLTTICTTADSVYNYINLFYYYGFVDMPIAEPYALIGYVLYKIDLKKDWEKYGDFVDSFIVGVLEASGKLDLQENPYYQPWKDENILCAVEKWRCNR